MDNMPEGTVLSQYTPGFRANLQMAPQQTDTRLGFAVEADFNAAGPGTHFNADDVLPTDPEDDDTRVPDTPDKFPEFGRRVGWYKGFRDSAWLDTVDKLNSITDPTSPIMASLTAGRWRKADDNIMNGMLGVAYESAGPEEPPTVVAFDTANYQLPADYKARQHQDEEVPASGAFGMSIGKMIQAQKILDESDLEGERFTAFSPSCVADLLERTPTTSRYYGSVQALVEGKVDTLLGFKIIRVPTKRFLLQSGQTDIIRVPFWIKPAVIHKAQTITQARVAIRHDKSDTPQAFYRSRHATSRRYDVGVVDVLAKIV